MAVIEPSCQHSIAPCSRAEGRIRVPERPSLYIGARLRRPQPPLLVGRVALTLPSTGVGVEMTIARNPLHGSGRAELPHPALASGTTASRLRGKGWVMRRGSR